MSTYRTAQGRKIDMAALISKNEKTRAVGNMNVNARGDTIDNQGKVIKPRNQHVNERYEKTVNNKHVQSSVRQSQPKRETIVEDKLPNESDFNDSDDLEIEQIKQQEKTKKGKK
jgi:hypothetical protein